MVEKFSCYVIMAKDKKKNSDGKSKSNAPYPLKDLDVRLNLNLSSKDDAREMAAAISEIAQDKRDGSDIRLVDDAEQVVSVSDMAKMFDLANRGRKITADFRTSDQTMSTRKWPSTNLVQLPMGPLTGRVEFRETLPQYHEKFPSESGRVRNISIACDRLAYALCSEWDLGRPHTYHEPKKEFDIMSNYNRCREGVNLDALRYQCEQLPSNREYRDVVSGLINSCRYHPGVAGTVRTEYSDFGFGTFVDGPIRGSILSGCQDIYSQSLRLASTIYEEARDSVPSGWDIGRIDEKEKQCLVYAEPPEPIIPEHLATLGPCASAIVSDVCAEYSRGIKFEPTSVDSATTAFVSGLSLNSQVSSELRSITSRITERGPEVFI